MVLGLNKHYLALSLLCVFMIIIFLAYKTQNDKDSKPYALVHTTTKKTKGTTDPKHYALVHTTTQKTKGTAAVIQPVCNASFGRTLRENIAKIKSYNLSEANKYFKHLNSVVPFHNDIANRPGLSTGDLPVIVTAASGNHYLESLEMLYSLKAVVMPAYPTIPVYYFDLGLEPHQKKEVKQICNCIVLDFPFNMFPTHVRRLKAYCWKPLIIKMMLQRYRFVMWMDASIQFKTSRLDDLFSRAKQYGVLMYHNVWSLPAHVHRDTFTFLTEPPCLYKNFTEFHAGLILINTANSIVKNYIIDPWVKCALIENCMKTKHNEMEIIKCASHTKFHVCHRFDQAVLSILIYRLYHGSYKNHDINIRRYFKICYNQSCKRRQQKLNKKKLKRNKKKTIMRYTRMPSNQK